MKVSKPAFSAPSSSQSSSTISCSTCEPSSALKNVEPSGVTATISPSLGNCTSRVSRRNAAALEARYVSPAASPTTIGHWWRAPTSRPGWSRWIATNA